MQLYVNSLNFFGAMRYRDFEIWLVPSSSSMQKSYTCDGGTLGKFLKNMSGMLTSDNHEEIVDRVKTVEGNLLEERK